MPVTTEIQNKVLEIASNPMVAKNVKLAVRKKFYELKNEEIKVEEVQQVFDAQVEEFDGVLNTLKEKIEGVKVKKQQEEPTPSIEDQEEILIQKPKSGVNVRMQEELEETETDDTDFEVPFEIDQ